MNKIKHRINLNKIGDTIKIPVTLTEDVDYDVMYSEVLPESREVKPKWTYESNKLRVYYNLTLVDDEYVQFVIEDPNLVHLFSIGEVLEFGTNVPYEALTISKIESGRLYCRALRSFTDGPNFERGYLIKDAVVNEVDDEYIIQGTTSSKLNYIVSSFTTNPVIGEIVNLKSIDNIQGKIIYSNSSESKYELFSGDNPITYVDKLDGSTTFTVKRDKQMGLKEQALIPAYHNMIEEPKITNNLFIDRGVNTALDPLSKLHSIKNLHELEKSGFNTFRVNKTGFEN